MFNFKDTRRKIAVPLAVSTNLTLHKKSTKLDKKKTNKKKSWPDFGPRSAGENSAECLIRNGEIPSPRQTPIDKTNDGMKHERGALVRGSDPRSGHSVDETAGDMWRLPARRLIPNHLAAGMSKTDDQNSRSLSDGSKYSFFQV